MWDVCSNNTPVASLSPSGNKFMNSNDDDDDGSAAGFRSPHENGQRIKPFSPESHYKSQIFMQSVLDLHKSKSTLELREGSRNWSPEAHHPSQPCDVFPRFAPIVDANLHHRLTRGSGPPGLPERFHHHPGLNGGPLMAGGGVVPSKLHGDLMRAEEKSVSSSTGIGSHQVKTFRAIRCYHCRMCDQEFVNKSDMQRHAKEIHRMEDKGYKCVKCLKSFPSSQQLAQHSLVHTNVRKYPCRFCDKAFKQLSHVQQHLRIHTGERPYQCAVEGCSKSFRQLSSLQQHIKGHNIPLPKSYSILHSNPSAGNDLPKDKIRTSLARPTNLICQICEKHCANEIRYFQHIHKNHPDFWRVFSSGRPLSDFIDIDDERPIAGHGGSSRSLYGNRMERAGSMGGDDCGGSLLIGGEERGTSQSEPLLSCCVCKKLFAREAYLLRHLETNKEDEQHRVSLIEMRKDSAAFFAAARYDSGALVDEIKMEGDSDMVGGGSTSSAGGMNEGRSSASNGVDDVFRGSSSSQSGLNVDDAVKMRSRSNSPSNGPLNIKNSQVGVEDLFQGRNSTNSEQQQQQGILTTSSSSSSSSATSDLELFSPSSSASQLQTSSSHNNHSSHPSQHRFYSDQHQRFDACRGDTLPFSATPGPLYYSLSHGQSPFFGGRRRSNEAEQLYRRRSEVMNPFTSLDFSAGTRDFMGRDIMGRDLMGRDLIGRDAMTPFYSPSHMDERRGTGSEDMFPGVGGMGGMFDHSAASAAAGRLISGLR